MDNYYNPLDAARPVGPHGKRFEPHELRRLPVVLSEEARQQILESSAEGRKFPQALSELFGAVTGVKELHIDAVPRSRHVPVGPQDFHPVSGLEDRLLVVHIVHEDDSIDPYQYILNVKDLQETYVGGKQGFSALLTAQELIRLYPHRK